MEEFYKLETKQKKIRTRMQKNGRNTEQKARTWKQKRTETLWERNHVDGTE